MKPTRQVVIVTGEDGVTVGHDGPATTRHVFEHTPGLEVDRIWATAGEPQVPVADAAPPAPGTVLPAVGDTRFFILTLPPDAALSADSFDPAAAAAEQAAVLPDFAEVFEPEAPGMHTTDTIDYVVVLEGPVTLELDDERSVVLQTSDVVVQLGARHAWRNHTDGQVRLAAVLVGAHRVIT